jgi:hypothetical protein
MQHLAIDKRRFCVEMPTRETYQQNGTTPMSARVDLTVVDDNREPVAHVEFKAHNCTVENIRKDLEKLLRERRTGCWFHTLERANAQTLRAIIEKFSRAFSLLRDHLPQGGCSYLFALFVLDSGALTFQWLHFTGKRLHDDSLLQVTFSEPQAKSPWVTMFLRGGAPTSSAAKKQITVSNKTTVKGRRQGFLALIPKIEPHTYVHISERGGSYRIRIYDPARPTAPPKVSTMPEYPNFDTLLESKEVVEWISATAEDLKYNIDDQPQYWCDRIRKLNTEKSKAVTAQNPPNRIALAAL